MIINMKTLITIIFFIFNSIDFPIQNTSWEIIDASVTFNKSINEPNDPGMVTSFAKRKIKGIVLKIKEDSMFLIKDKIKIQKAKLIETDEEKIIFEQQGKFFTYTYKLSMDGKYCTFTLPSGNFLKGIKME